MRNDWLMVQLGDVCETTSGGTPLKSKKEYYKNGTIPWLKSGEVNQGIIYSSEEYITESGLKNSSAKIFPEDTVLIAMYGATAGKVGLLKFESTTNQAICGILPNILFLSKFLYVYLTAKTSHMVKLSSGGAQPNISQKIIREIDIPLVSLPEQRAIVKKIGTLFKLIDESKNELKSAKETIKIHRQAVLKKAFDGELTHKWRNEKNISHSWDEKTVKNSAVSIQYGYTESATKKQIGPKFLRITDIQNNSVKWSDVPFVKIDNETKKKYLLKEGDLVFARTGATVGKSFLIKGNIPESVYASYLIRVRFPKNILSEYIAYYFQSPFYWEQVKNKQVGTGQPNVNGTKLGKIKIPIPSFQEQSQIVKKIENAFSNCDKTEADIKQHLQNIELLRQSLLKKAFSGSFLSKKELEVCRKSPKWKPAKELLKEIQKEKNRETKNEQKNLKPRRKRKAV